MKTICLMTLLLSVTISANATLVFTFEETDDYKTLVSVYGQVDMTGTNPSGSPYNIGWDNISPNGSNNSYTWLADSDYFSFNYPNVSGTNLFYGISSSTLEVGGSNLRYLRMDGIGAPYPFFALSFFSPLPQTGTVTASGSARIGFDFDNLPYSRGTILDLKGDGSILFKFVPEPGSIALFCLGLMIAGKVKYQRRRIG